jgi:predicted ArsR family transcriptional regulator
MDQYHDRTSFHPCEIYLSPVALRSSSIQANSLRKESENFVELEAFEDHYCLRGYSCPLVAGVSTHPEACRLTEALLTELVGAPVQEHCGESGKLQCYFTVASQ